MDADALRALYFRWGGEIKYAKIYSIQPVFIFSVRPGLKVMARDMVSLAQRRFAARKMLKELALERKAAVRDIVGRYNEPRFVALRVEFIKRASALGCGCITIGRILGRDHTTVLYHLNGWKPRKRAWERAKQAREAQHVG